MSRRSTRVASNRKVDLNDHSSSEDAASDRSFSPPRITGLADNIPDPPDTFSDEDDEQDQGVGKQSDVPTPTDPGQENVVIVEISADPSAAESASQLNRFIGEKSSSSSQSLLPPPGRPVRTLKPTKASKLKRLNESHTSDHLGLNPSGRGQRNLASDPRDVFDPDAHTENLIQRHSSLDWQVKDTAPPRKKQRLRPEPVKAKDARSDALNNVEDKSISPVHSNGAKELAPVKKVGRPRKSDQPNAASTVHSEPLETPLTTKRRGRPRKSDLPAVPSPAHSEVVQKSTERKLGRARKSAPSYITSLTQSEITEKAASGKKRGRPRKSNTSDVASPTHPEPLESESDRKRGRPCKSSLSNVTSPRVEESDNPASCKKARDPRRSIPIGGEPSSSTAIQTADGDHDPSKTMLSHASIDSATPQTSSQKPVDEDQARQTEAREAPGSETPPTMTENGQQSQPSQDTQHEGLAQLSEQQPGEPSGAKSSEESADEPRNAAETAERASPPVTQKDAQEDQDLPEQSSSGERPQEESVPSYELTASLQAAFHAVRTVGLKKERGHEIKYALPAIRSDEAKKIAKTCNDTKNYIVSLEATKEGDQSEQSSGLTSLVEKLSVGATEILQGSWDKKKIVRDVYVHIIPKMTSVLCRILRHYNCHLISELSYEQLRLCRTLMKTVVKLGDRFGKANSKFVTDFPIRGLVKNNIVSNIRQAMKVFTRRMLSIKKKAEAEERLARQQEYQRQREVKEQRLAREEELVGEWQRFWGNLHLERLRVEQSSGLIAPSKINHLRTVPLEDFRGVKTEFDANGQPFVRVEAFAQRQSQLPGRQSFTHTNDWQQNQSYDLFKGLKDFNGPRVYHKIFWKYCRPGQSLNNFNVTEIVDHAVWLRNKVIEAYKDQTESPEPWVLQITDPREIPDIDIHDDDSQA